MDTPSSGFPAPSSAQRLSYKFQRLRERIRGAITSGELNGKLPGERELAGRFKANPKTLSKALTDLAAEGLLDRSIGRGTYVRGASSPGRKSRRWLILCEPEQQSSALVEHLRHAHEETDVGSNGTRFRPSFLGQFSTVIDVSRSTPDEMHRALIVRGLCVVLVNRQPGRCNLPGVLLDRSYAAFRLGREVFLAGHRRILVVEDAGDTTASAAVRLAAGRYAPQAAVESCAVDALETMLDRDFTAAICDGTPPAERIRQINAHHAPISFAALGIASAQPPCTGIYVEPAELAEAAATLAREAQHHPPAVLWLTGTFVDRGTVRAVAEHHLQLSDLGQMAATPA